MPVPPPAHTILVHENSSTHAPLQQEPLATTFTCLFCNHEKSVTVKIDRKAGTGHLNCKVCGQTFQTGVNCESPKLDS